MRFQFKSLLILSEREERVPFGTETTTVYDLHRIGEHTFDEPSGQLWLDPVHLLVVALFGAPVWGLTLFVAAKFTGGRVWSMPWVLAGLIAFPVALFYPLSVHGLIFRKMKAQARRERRLADHVQINVVREADWETFRASLKQADAADQISLLSAHRAQLPRNQQQPKPLPNQNALQKWEGQTGETDAPPKENDKLTERPTDVKPGLGNPNSLGYEAPLP